MKNNKYRQIIIANIAVLVIVLSTIVVIYTKNAYSINSSSFTRKEMQDIVVSTALSYYYNNAYNDYEGYWADDVHSEFSTMYNVTPEMLSSSKYMTTQCEAFTAVVYLHSFGYDFSSFRNVLIENNPYTTYKLVNNNSVTTKWGGESDTDFENLYKYFSKAISVNFLNNIAKNIANNTSKVSENKENSILVATYQWNTNANKVDAVYGFKGNYTNDITHMSNYDSFLNEVKDLLQPGDIILNNGHAMLWIGDSLESDGGIIHSSGASYTKNSDGTTNSGYDSSNVTYSSAEYLYNSQIRKHGTSDNTIFTILRPINALCDGTTNNICQLDNTKTNVNNNVKARVKLNDLKVMQYLYSVTRDTTLSYDSSSVTPGEKISYRLVLQNKSNINFCSSGFKTNATACKDSGWTWKTTTNNKKYSGIKISAEIPKNTTFISCTNSCTVSGNNVIWSNVTSNPGNNVTYSYTVQINDSTNINEIENKGMRVNYEGEELKLTSIKTPVDSALVGKYSEMLLGQVSTDTNNNSQKFNSSLAYITDFYDKYFSNTNITISNKNNKLSSILTADNIRNAIFNKNSFDNYYTRKLQTQINSLNSNEKAINEMLVPGFYGGMLYEKLYYSNIDNMSQFDRVKPLWSSRIYFNPGDIIVTLKKDSSRDQFTIMNALMYTGLVYDKSTGYIPTYTYYDVQNSKVIRHRIIRTKYQGRSSEIDVYSNRYLMDIVYASDLYVALRPSNYYKPKLNYNINLILGDGIKWSSSTCKSPYTFDSATESCIKNIKYLSSDNKLPIPTREGYTFEGWYQENTYQHKIGDGGSEINPTSNMTLYAKWIKEETKTPDSNQENNSGNNQAKDPEKEPNTKTPENNSGNNQENNQTKDPEKEQDKTNDLITYKITFDTDGGTEIQSLTIKKDEKISKPDNPTKTGYKFIEWQVNNKTFDFDTLVNEDIVLKAKWEKVNQNNDNQIINTNKRLIITITLIILILTISLVVFKNIKKKRNIMEQKH